MFGRPWTLSQPARRSAGAVPRRSSAATSAVSLPTPTLADDGAHAAQFAQHVHKEWFTEWWYFNVRDPKTGVALLATYVVDPFSALAPGVFAAVVYRPGQEPVEVGPDVYPKSQVSTSPTLANVQIGPNRVEVIDDDHYRIVASSRDGRVSWSIVLERMPGAGPAWLLPSSPGPLSWEIGWWMTWMPFARASGTITIDGVELTIHEASAYHDHNWGVWLAPARNWQWLQTSSVVDGVALDLGYSDGFDPPRVAVLQLGAERFDFEWGGIELPAYTGFQSWPDTPWKYPGGATVSLIDRTNRVRVDVAWTALATKPLLTGILVFEQYVDVTLQVAHRGSDGKWQPSRSFTMDGISEWSDSYSADWQTGEGLWGAYKARATVFGGGIAGLTAAHELTDRGFAVTVVEPEVALDAQGARGMAIGGMARSHYARVPRLGGAPVNRPAGRPTPSSRNDHWTNRAVAFDADSAALSPEGERRIDEAARAFLVTYVEQGYRLRVSGAANPVEKEPRALGARRAEAVRDRLIATGVSPDCIALREDLAGQRPEAAVALEDYVLPGEHGYRFFPSYYRHVTETMGRIPVYDESGRQTDRRVLDRLRPSKNLQMVRSGQPASNLPMTGTTSPLQALRAVVGALVNGDYDPRDFLQMALRIARYQGTCPERRVALEDMSWWSYLCGYSQRTGCYLYRYSDAFTNTSLQAGRVLAAFDWMYGDARTNGSTFMQLFQPLPDKTPSPFDGFLDGPTTEAWFTHWRRYLGDRGVRFVSGSLERLELERVDGKDAVVPWVVVGDKPPAPWIPRTREPHYVVVATDAPGAESASRPLPKVGVPKGLVGYTTTFDGRTRNPYEDPGIEPWDRFQSLPGVQYFFDQSFSIGDSLYSLDAPWSLSAISMNNIWTRVRFKEKDGFAGFFTVDVGDFKVPSGSEHKTAWDSTYERIGEQVWLQIASDVRYDPMTSPLRLPRPSWFHVDDNLVFGDRDGMKGVVVKNLSPYLVPIRGEWKLRPGPEPFDPNVPDATRPGPPEPGVWSAPHGGYPVHWDSLVYAGIYLKTFTRMTTMESANESGRHAVNAILDHYNAHHGSTIPLDSPSPAHHPEPWSLEADEVPARFIGDYCGIWNIERYENSSYDTLKAIDQILVDLNLPHLFDLLGVELVPSILSHLFPYRGDFSPWNEPAPPPDPKPKWYCPPFVGGIVGKAVGKVVGAVTRAKDGPSVAR